MLSKNKFYFLIFLKYFFLESKMKLKSSKNHLKMTASHTFFFTMFDLFCVCAVNTFLIQIFCLVFFRHLRWKRVLHIRNFFEKDKHFKIKFHASEI